MGHISRIGGGQGYRARYSPNTHDACISAHSYRHSEQRHQHRFREFEASRRGAKWRGRDRADCTCPGNLPRPDRQKDRRRCRRPAREIRPWPLSVRSVRFPGDARRQIVESPRQRSFLLQDDIAPPRIDLPLPVRGYRGRLFHFDRPPLQIRHGPQIFQSVAGTGQRGGRRTVCGMQALVVTGLFHRDAHCSCRFETTVQDPEVIC